MMTKFSLDKIFGAVKDFVIILVITCGLWGLLELGFCISGKVPLSQDPLINPMSSFSPAINLCESNPGVHEIECKPEKTKSTHRHRKIKTTIQAFGGSSLVYSHDKRTDEPSFIELTNRNLISAGKDIFISNYGSPCKDSYYIKSCVADAAPAKPNFVLFYEGHNDVINIGYATTSTKIWLKNNPHALAALIFFSRT